ncbi:hypothetical protein F5884DRAFT_861556 [Xylogone sp. PMI_703]|nr:hypothetical protein F5884DRAFT_861556 [Xylogone sp. PMI_703]
MFLADFLGKPIYEKVVQLPSRETVENSIGLNPGFHNAFDRACFVLDPLLDTIQRDPETKEIITYLVCFQVYRAQLWEEEGLVLTVHREHDPIGGSQVIYDTFYGRANVSVWTSQISSAGLRL